MLATKQFGVSKRCYSSTVSQDFLKNVLERVKETASRKDTTLSRPRKNTVNARADKKGGSARHSNRRNGASGKGGNNINGNNINGNNSNGNRFQEQIVQRTKPAINVSIINRQPQFKRAGKDSGSGSVVAESAEDLMDVLESTSAASSHSRSARTPRNMPRTARKTQRNVPGLAKDQASTNDIISQAKKHTELHVYAPDEPTPLSLLKYSPNLSHCPVARLSKYSLATLEQANFPLYRQVNLGVSSTPHAKPENVSLSPKSEFFGQYTPGSSLILQKERLLKNTATVNSLEQFEASVKGQYAPLKPFTTKDFASLAKSDKKRAELVRNSEVVRLSLEANTLDTAKKELVYQVCSGLKPVSTLRA